MEFARFCIPRRTYTQAHLDYVVSSVLRVKERAGALRGYRIVKAEKILRHFTAQLEPDA
jgi:tryptophanase